MTLRIVFSIIFLGILAAGTLGMRKQRLALLNKYSMQANTLHSHRIEIRSMQARISKLTQPQTIEDVLLSHDIKLVPIWTPLPEIESVEPDSIEDADNTTQDTSSPYGDDSEESYFE